MLLRGGEDPVRHGGRCQRLRRPHELRTGRRCRGGDPVRHGGRSSAFAGPHELRTRPRRLSLADEPPRPPSVDALARSLAAGGRRCRTRCWSTSPGAPSPPVTSRARQRDAAAVERALLRPVVNASGVLLHTNLGRAPLGVAQPAAYSNLELDLATGRARQPTRHAGTLLARLCGAESALVVNNGAAAVLLVLAALAGDGRGRAVSRGESGRDRRRVPHPRRVRAVGRPPRRGGHDEPHAPGRLHRRPSTGPTCALHLKVHRSNYRITGFTEDDDGRELADGSATPVVVDLGRGLLDAAARGCRTVRRRGCTTSPPPARRWPTVRPRRDVLAATSCSAGRRPASSPGGPSSSSAARGIRCTARCAPAVSCSRALQDVALAYLARTSSPVPVLADGGGASGGAHPTSRRRRCGNGCSAGEHRGGARGGIGARHDDPLGRRGGRR